MVSDAADAELLDEDAGGAASRDARGAAGRRSSLGPPDEPEDVLVPADTSDPTEIGSAVITPSIGAVTTVSLVSATASS